MANRDYDSKSHDWWTPEEIIEMILTCHGITAVDCDPAADEAKHIPAKVHYTKADNGLIQPWPEKGVTWVNPPYGPDLQKYMRKCMDHAKKNPQAHIWAIVPSRRFETKYYQELVMSCNFVFILVGKPVFGINGVFDQTAKFGVMLCYWGPWHRLNFLNFIKTRFPNIRGTIIKGEGTTI